MKVTLRARSIFQKKFFSHSSPNKTLNELFRLFKLFLNKEGDIFGSVELPDFLVQVFTLSLFVSFSSFFFCFILNMLGQIRLRDPAIGIRVGLKSIRVTDLDAGPGSLYQEIISLKKKTKKKEAEGEEERKDEKIKDKKKDDFRERFGWQQKRPTQERVRIGRGRKQMEKEPTYSFSKANNAIEVSYKRYDDAFKLQLMRQIAQNEHFIPPPPLRCKKLIPERGFHHLLRVRVTDLSIVYVASFLRKFFWLYDGFFWEGEEMTLKAPDPLPPSLFEPIKRMEVGLYGVKICIPDMREIAKIDKSGGGYKSQDGMERLKEGIYPEVVIGLGSVEIFREMYLPSHRASPHTTDPKHYKDLRQKMSVSLTKLSLRLMIPSPLYFQHRRPLGKKYRRSESVELWEKVQVKFFFWEFS